MPRLVRLLQSDRIDLRRGAARALGWLGLSDAAAAAALVSALHSPDDELREASLYALGQLRAATAVAAIREALSDKNERVRFEAKMALQALDSCVSAKNHSQNGLLFASPRQVGEVGRFITPAERVTQVAFLPDGRRAFSTGFDGVFRLWDIATSKEIRSLRIENAREALALSPDGRWIACGGMYQRINLVDFETGVRKRQFTYRDQLLLLAIRPQENLVVSVDQGQRGPPYMLHVWDVASGREARSFALPFGALRGWRFPPMAAVCLARGFPPLPNSPTGRSAGFGTWTRRRSFSSERCGRRASTRPSFPPTDGRS